MISVDSSLDPADAERDSISHTKTMTTESSEDYLEAIFVIRAERGSCRNVDIAEYLGITKPSVTRRFQASPPNRLWRWSIAMCGSLRGGLVSPRQLSRSTSSSGGCSATLESMTKWHRKRLAVWSTVCRRIRLRSFLLT